MKLGIIGVGNLAQCLIERIGESKCNIDIILYDIDSSKKKFSKKSKFKFQKRIGKEISSCEILLLVVKPQVFPKITNDILKYVSKKTIIVSLMAGIKLNKINKDLNNQFVTARVMTNINAKYGNALSFVYYKKNVEKKVISRINLLFKLFGTISDVKSELQLDKITALCGSGPAYFIHFAEIIKNAFKRLGFKDKDAEDLARNMFYATGFTCHSDKRELKSIKNTVVSRKGTTEAALKQMTKGNVEKIIVNSIIKAYQRSIQLGKDK
tara:strand:- start:3344 stop:4144 length:801 start_codon:yes stop_codon:yes gene_type:complete